MSPGNAVARVEPSAFTPEQAAGLIIKGDLSTLNIESRTKYMVAMCALVGMHPASHPFDYVTLNGKLVLYANKACTDQLRKIQGVSCRVVSRGREGNVYFVQVTATLPSGREDFATGAVPIDKRWDRESGKMVELDSTDVSNAMMKAETKAKRRATLSICGLGMLDETELETIVAAKPLVSEKTLGRLMDVSLRAGNKTHTDVLGENLKAFKVTEAEQLTEEQAGSILALLEE